MGHAPQQPLAARCDSFVVEADVHYPTDVSLLWDALRCMLRSVAAACGLRGVRGWRQKRRWLLKMKPLSHRVHSSNQSAKRFQRVELYVRQAVHLAERARVSLEALESAGCAEATRSEITTYVDLVEGLAGQVKRRVLEGETIPQEENVFSIFTPHTRWCAKGKADPAVESSINNLECRGLDRIREQGPRASSSWCGWGCWRRTCTGSDVWYGMGSAIACGAMDVAKQPRVERRSQTKNRQSIARIMNIRI